MLYGKVQILTYRGTAEPVVPEPHCCPLVPGHQSSSSHPPPRSADYNPPQRSKLNQSTTFSKLFPTVKNTGSQGFIYFSLYPDIYIFTSVLWSFTYSTIWAKSAYKRMRVQCTKKQMQVIVFPPIFLLFITVCVDNLKKGSQSLIVFCTGDVYIAPSRFLYISKCFCIKGCLEGGSRFLYISKCFCIKGCLEGGRLCHPLQTATDTEQWQRIVEVGMWEVPWEYVCKNCTLHWLFFVYKSHLKIK